VNAAVRATSPHQTLAGAVDDGSVPGVVALAANEHGVLYAGAFGLRALGQPAPMTLDTVFRVASMTKLVTVIAAMQLVEQGRLALDEPIGESVPELRDVRVLEGFNAGGDPLLRSPRLPITLRQLLTHTSGHAYASWNSALHQLEQRSGAQLGVLDAPLTCDPGERWQYGAGVDWTGRIVERTTGESLEDYFRAHIFEPLGMHDTGYITRDDQRARQASRHIRPPDGSLLLNHVEMPARPVTFSGGNGLVSTGPDYLRLLRMFVAGGTLDSHTILRAETVDEFGRNQIGEISVEPLKSMTEMSNDIAFFPGIVKKWGLGGLITTQATPSGRSPGSWSWGGMLNTYFWVDPARSVAGLLLTQILPFCDAQVLTLLEHFESDIYAAIA
jgi:CubicO group peptidase (beta-lactamase class C family)